MGAKTYIYYYPVIYMEAAYRLSGAYKRTLDRKSHVHIPPDYLKVFRKRSIDGLLLKKEQEGSRRYLGLYPAYSDGPGPYPFVSIDNFGRIIIPRDLIEYAGLKRTVIFHADPDADRIALWAGEEKEADLKENIVRYGDLMELKRLGIEIGEVFVPKEIHALLQKEKALRSQA